MEVGWGIQKTMIVHESKGGSKMGKIGSTLIMDDSLVLKSVQVTNIITFDHLITLKYPCRKAECLPVYYQSPTLVGTPNSKPNRLENCHVFSKWSLQRTIKLIHLNKTEHLQHSYNKRLI